MADNHNHMLKRFASLETQRQTWESTGKSGELCRAAESDVTKNRSPGDKRSELVFDGTISMQRSY